MNEQNITVATKEEILSMLNAYNGTFSKEVMEYIDSLIELETSVLSKTECSEKIIELLTQTEFFRKLAVYNIFKRLVRLMDREGIFVKDRNNCLGGI